jgi:3-isopropylmalate dehydrogenase
LKANILLLAGDGIGPEVTTQARRALEAVAARFGHSFAFAEELLGGCAIDAVGDPLPDATLAACERADAVLLGAVGGPKWSDPKASKRPEQGLLGLRKALAVYANLRPVRPHPALLGASPLKPELLAGVDLLVVRELTGGIYFGAPRYREKHASGQRAIDTMEYTSGEIRRVVKLAFELARGRRRKVTSIDKANVLETSRLWREVAMEVGADYSDIELEHQLVDSGAMRLVTGPAAFDVIVTGNLFGDILTDEAAVLTGSLGNLPSASLGDSKRGLYEPIHGSAPDIAGQGIANPVGMILSAAMLLRHSLGLEDAAAALEAAVDRAITEGARTRDLGGALSTVEMADRVIAGI